MVKYRQPPMFLLRVLRTVAGLHNPNGVTVSRIVKQVRDELSSNGRPARNLTMHIRRALNYAVEIGALKHKAGKYRMAGKRKVYPIDSLEMLMDSRSRKIRKKSTKTKRRSKNKDKSHSRRETQQKSNKSLKSGSTRANLRIEKEKSQSLSEYSEKSDDQNLNIQHSGGPTDKNKDLTRNKSVDRQTSYPKYNDTMPGDDRKSLDNVPQRPRRQRPAPLPTNPPVHQLPTLNDDDIQDTNAFSLLITALFILSLWHGLHQAMGGI